MTCSFIFRCRNRLRSGAWTGLLCLLAWPLVGLFGAPAHAARIVRFNEVTVPASDQATAFADAMRAALVRATGRRDADQDPVFAELLADPRRYVQQYGPAPGGGLAISFDAAALERAITGAQRSVWPKERPVVLVVVADLPAGTDPIALRRALEDVAAQRGLPLQFADGGVAGAASLVALPADAALAAARHLGADALLSGRASAEGAWTWSLAAGSAPETFSGSLAAGVQGAADSIARSSDSVMAQVEVETVVQVSGVRSLRDYAAVARLLASAAGVRAVSPVEVTGEAVLFRVVARGGAEGLSQVLASSGPLRPTAAGGGRLTFDYLP
jgi:hypothetical protein